MQEVDSTADKQIFPFFMMNEQKLYAEISKMLADLYKSPARMKHGLLKLADQW